MDSSEKIALFLTSVLLSLFVLAILISSKVMDIDVPECIPADNVFETGSVKAIDEAAKQYEVKYVAKMWGFDPPVVEVPAGSELDIYLTSPDVVHGFYLRGTNCNLMAVPGALTKQTVTLTDPGRYPIYCHEYCGTGHHFMKGEIIVLPDGAQISKK